MSTNTILTYGRILFPSEQVSPGFISSLCDSDIKSAFRKQAFANHPDTSDATSVKFQEVKDAYSALLEHVNSRTVVKISGVHPQFQHRHKDAYPYRPPRTYPKIKSPKKPAGGTYYKGEFPTFKLKTGLFLYHRGLIPYEALVNAMIWQQKKRARIGEIAVEIGWITHREVDFIRAATELSGSFGNRAVSLGLLTKDQVDILLRYQRLSLCQLGQYFVNLGYLSHGELNRELRNLKKHNESVEQRKTGSTSAAA